jgi:hypothetical protein
VSSESSFRKGSEIATASTRSRALDVFLAQAEIRSVAQPRDRVILERKLFAPTASNTVASSCALAKSSTVTCVMCASCQVWKGYLDGSSSASVRPSVRPSRGFLSRGPKGLVSGEESPVQTPFVMQRSLRHGERMETECLPTPPSCCRCNTQETGVGSRSVLSGALAPSIMLLINIPFPFSASTSGGCRELGQ